MDNIYNLYRDDLPGLEAITGKFISQLIELQQNAVQWANSGNWEMLHRRTHQLKSTAILYELPALTETLKRIADLTRTAPDNAVQERVLQYCEQLPVQVTESRYLVAQKMPDVPE
jgi:hypothetical protein